MAIGSGETEVVVSVAGLKFPRNWRKQERDFQATNVAATAASLAMFLSAFRAALFMCPTVPANGYATLK